VSSSEHRLRKYLAGLATPSSGQDREIER
jgi:hypothetical protein